MMGVEFVALGNFSAPPEGVDPADVDLGVYSIGKPVAYPGARSAGDRPCPWMPVTLQTRAGMSSWSVSSSHSERERGPSSRSGARAVACRMTARTALQLSWLSLSPSHQSATLARRLRAHGVVVFRRDLRAPEGGGSGLLRATGHGLQDHVAHPLRPVRLHARQRFQLRVCARRRCVQTEFFGSRVLLITEPLSMIPSVSSMSQSISAWFVPACTSHELMTGSRHLRWRLVQAVCGSFLARQRPIAPAQVQRAAGGGRGVHPGPLGLRPPVRRGDADQRRG